MKKAGVVSHLQLSSEYSQSKRVYAALLGATAFTRAFKRLL